MSFALLADSGSEDLKELLKKANAKETKAPEAVAAPAQQQSKPKSAGKKEDRPARKPRSDDNGEAVEGGRPQRGGRGGRGRGQKHHGYVPPKRGFEHDRSVSRTGRGKEVQKGGHGKFNYGKEGEEVQATEQTAETPKEENTTPAAEGAQAAEKKPVEEEVDNSVTYEEFKKQQAEKKKAIEALVSKSKDRQADQIKYDTSIAKFVEKPEEKKAEAPAAEKPKKAEEKSSGPVTVSLQELLKDQPIKHRRDNREFRGRGRGGRGRGGRGGSRPARQAPAPEFNAKDFPTLK